MTALRGLAGPRPSVAVQAELFRRAQADPPDLAARDRLIAIHTPFALQFSGRYIGRIPGHDRDDLAQLARLGLIDAIARFDFTRDRKFTTYAQFWIRRWVRVALVNHSRFVRVPQYLWNERPRYRQAVAALAAELGRPPLLAEVAARLGIAPRQAETLRIAVRALDRKDFGAGEIRTRFADGAEATRLDLLTDDREPPEAAAERREALDRLRAALARLTPTDRAILAARYGLDGREPETPARLAERIGITREGVQCREAAALGRLRDILAPDDGAGAPATASGKLLAVADRVPPGAPARVWAALAGLTLTQARGALARLRKAGELPAREEVA